jgi:hypothetical protein
MRPAHDYPIQDPDGQFYLGSEGPLQPGEYELALELNHIRNSTPEELRIPTSAFDLAQITSDQRVMESLEQRYAESRLATGKVVYMTEGYRQSRKALISMTQVERVQQRARTKGWR